jgi:SRSO17 transposase
MANFMTRAHFNDEGLLKQYQKQLAEEISCPGGMITVDGCDFPKKGHNSVGVQRQHCGPLGKVDNCQASVMVGYTSDKGYGLVNRRLYMPEKWLTDDFSALREECKVPEGLEHKTKNVIASEMINEMFNSGLFNCKYLGADAAFGSDSNFLDSLPEGLIYFTDIRNNIKMFEIRPEIATPEYAGKGRKPHPKPVSAPRTVRDIAADASYPWQEVVLGMGAKGPIITRDKCIRVVEVRDKMPGKDVWLYVRQLEDGSVKYALCNASIDADIEEVRAPALMRWSVEQNFHECKKYLGMDHYEVRSWPGWHRHILFTFIAHLFINKLRRKFSIYVDEPHGPAPFVEAPVPLDDYRKAVVDARNGKVISHPRISAYPKRRQQVLTIGLMKLIIQPLMARMGATYDHVAHSLKSASGAYVCHSQTKINTMMLEAAG